jgi:hypothetical protein
MEEEGTTKGVFRRRRVLSVGGSAWWKTFRGWKIGKRLTKGDRGTIWLLDLIASLPVSLLSLSPLSLPSAISDTTTKSCSRGRGPLASHVALSHSCKGFSSAALMSRGARFTLRRWLLPDHPLSAKLAA